MARIRTIKPEFPQSESMGRVSRDARLFFVMLWTICDDEGRARGNSRMLASLLFPYDDDAPSLIDGWVSELEHENCVIRYVVDGSTYIQVCKWLNHQKIDKPSKSKIPPFDESSRTVANPRESSCVDLGPRILVNPPSSFANAQEEAPPKPEKKPLAKNKSEKVTLKVWMQRIKDQGERAVSDYAPVWEYAERIGLPVDWVQIAWVKFRERYEDGNHSRKRYSDWRRVFKTSVEGNWFRLWAYSDREQCYVLTTVGRQADADTREAA